MLYNEGPPSLMPSSFSGWVTDETPTYTTTGEGVLLDEGLRTGGAPLFFVSHSMVTTAPVRSPGAVAEADVDKILSLRAARRLTGRDMRRWLRASYRAQVPAMSAVRALIDRWKRGLGRGETLLIGYSSRSQTTLFSGPRDLQIEIGGYGVMCATWRIVFASPTQPELGRSLVGHLAGPRPDP